MKTKEELKKYIESGKAVMGMELGSTRIKAVLIDESYAPIASGSFEWENSLVNGIWTYGLEEIHTGVKACYADLAANVKSEFGCDITGLAAIGISAMMHGYMAFDSNDKLLVPFRTWRNSITTQAADELTELFSFNVPERWSIAHLYQAILNGEEHTKDVSFFTTLAGYIHYLLTGKKVLSIGDASGMFPIDSAIKDYDAEMLDKFNVVAKGHGFTQDIHKLLPKVLVAGEDAGSLTAAGAAFLDTSGKLQPGIPCCPPEGDAGTGMTATNSVAPRTGNVSAGTSIFAMVVTEKPLSKVYREIDMVTTPTGAPVAMAHASNCTSDINAWVGILKEFAKLFGMSIPSNDLYTTLFRKSLEGDKDCGGLVSYGFYSGENMLNLAEGRPMFIRKPDSSFTLANFMRTHICAALATMASGVKLLTENEGVKIDKITGHGGFFKTEGVGQSLLAAAVNAPVTVMQTAGEGGAWGVALQAAYLVRSDKSETLEDFLDKEVFAGQSGSTLAPVPEDVEGFNKFMAGFKAGLEAEKAAVKAIEM